jgi:hypothetical protein
MASTRRRLLLVLQEPGYFRFYGSMVVELERRGWEALIAFDNPLKRGEAVRLPLGAGPGVRSVGALPLTGRSGILPLLRAAVDYLRYLEPRYKNARYLRRRSEKALPSALAGLRRFPILPRWVVGTTIGLLRGVEAMMPADRRVATFVADAAADVVFVSPLVMIGEKSGSQTEVVKAARAARIPTVVGVASWDHLTSKGLIRVVPDVVTVWNDAQRREANELHRIPVGRIVVSGAQSLDHWFDRADPRATTALREALGLDPARPIVLFVGSSRNMAPGTSEIGFVERWVRALRAAPADVLRGAQILVRPHPSNVEQWRAVDAGAMGVIIHPLGYSGMPMNDAEVETFRHSMLMSAAVVGVNTTAMIEAAILQRPVLTVRDGNFAHSQAETLHFEHLTMSAGGCVVVAGGLDEHIAQLTQVLANPADALAKNRQFVERFVRPLGIDRPATDALCDAIERVAAQTAAGDARGDHEPAGAAALARRGPR